MFVSSRKIQNTIRFIQSLKKIITEKLIKKSMYIIWIVNKIIGSEQACEHLLRGSSIYKYIYIYCKD